MFIGDAPPPGSTILKFEITVTDAKLCPQVSTGDECQGSPQESLLTGPVEIELKQLELESAFLGLTEVPTGTYEGAQLTFANPELKLLLANGTLAELESSALPLSPTTVTPRFTEPLNVTADTNLGFLVDFNVFDSIQSAGEQVTGVSPVVTLVELPATQQTIEEMEDTTGKVSDLTKTCPTGSFTLLDSLTGLPISNINFDSTTEFDDLSCETLANDQIVEVDLELRSPTQTSAEFFAEEIELVNPADEDGMEGVVFQVNSATQFVLLVHDEENLPNLPTGSLVTVAIPSQAEFRIDSDDLPVESLSFAGGEDVVAGQSLEVDVVEGSLNTSTEGCATVEANCTASAEKLKLKKGPITARVASLSSPDFTIDQLPSLFGNSTTLRPLSADCQACLIGSIVVTTSEATEFEDDLSGVPSLVVGNTVTVRGLLLKNGFRGPGPVGVGSPRLVARKVRRQQS